MSNDKITRSNLIMTKPKRCATYSIIKNCSLKNCISKNIPILLFSQKMHFKKHSKIAPSKNVFQNCCKLSIENKNTRYVNYSIFEKGYIEKLA